MAGATFAQQKVYSLHKDVCGQLGIGQATLEHRTLMGSLSAPSATGNQIYTGPGPQTEDLVATTVKVWCAFEPLTRQANPDANNPMFGQQQVATTRGQWPAIDDNGNTITVAQDDILIDVSGRKYAVQNPVLDPGNTLWTCFLTQLR